MASRTPMHQSRNSSIQLPTKKPAKAPSTAPMAVATSATISPTSKAVAVLKMARSKMSWPMMLVPNQCARGNGLPLRPGEVAPAAGPPAQPDAESRHEVDQDDAERQHAQAVAAELAGRLAPEGFPPLPAGAATAALTAFISGSPADPRPGKGCRSGPRPARTEWR